MIGNYGAEPVPLIVENIRHIYNKKLLIHLNIILKIKFC